MTKSPRKNVPDVGIELGAACMPSELSSDRTTAPGTTRPVKWKNEWTIITETGHFMETRSLFVYITLFQVWHIYMTQLI